MDNWSFDELLVQGTCAVLIDGIVSGTAWLVSQEGHLLTAGHIFVSEEHTREFQVRFAEDIPRTVFVTNHAFYVHGGLDYAVLKLEEPLRNRIPLPVSLSMNVSGQCRLYGYGATLSDRSMGRGSFLAPYDPQDVKGFRLFQLRSPELGEGGFSGGAVFSDELQAVVAIQVEATRATTGAGRDTILAMPLYRVAQMWHDLEGCAQEHRCVPESPITVHTTTGDRTRSIAKRSRIFISYKRGSIPDEPVALQVYEALSKNHDVFIDQKSMSIGVKWADRIEEELTRADYLITFLSSSSVHSEMVQGEIEAAFQLGHESGREGRPAILPIRLAYTEPFTYPLSAYLNHINWAVWNNPADTPTLIQDLQKIVSTNECSLPAGIEQTTVAQKSVDVNILPRPLPSAQLEMPEGTMDPDSNFYITRPGDLTARNTISRQGVTMTIKGPRQIGKSSLLVRTVNEARQKNKRIVLIDFQQIGKSVLSNTEMLIREFCVTIADMLGLESPGEKYWDVPLSSIRRCTRYMERYILKELDAPLLLAMDEVDIIFDTPCRSDFFGMLRSWHNSRAINPLWKNLDLTLVTSTEPYQFIDDLNQSPFNVGEIIEPTDFSEGHVADLAGRHGLPVALSKRLIALLGGHPYLTRRALYLLAIGRFSTEELFQKAGRDHGPFGDHLRSHFFRLHGKRDLIEGLMQIIRFGSCTNDRVVFRLQGAGLVRRDQNGSVIPRCKLYADYFGEHLYV